MSDLIELGRYSDAALAHIIRGRLEAEGIPAFCFDTGMNAVESIPLMFQVRLMVVEDDLEDARAVLAEASPPGDDAISADELIVDAADGRSRRRRWALYCVLAYFGVPVVAFIILLMIRYGAQ